MDITKNEFDGRLISGYEYRYNELGLRDSMETSGTAFGEELHPPAAVTTAYRSNALNQYKEITMMYGSPSVNRSVYDDDGNLIGMTGSSGKL